MFASFSRMLGSMITLVLGLTFLVPANAQTAPKTYLIGSNAPLNQSQVEALKQAGAQVKYTYKNFGGAAAVIASKDLRTVRALPFVTSVNEDTLKQLDSIATTPASAPAALPGTPYWLDLIDAEKNTTYTGEGVWVAVLDSGFYPNWRDYFQESNILTQYATAFVAANGNQNNNQWDVGSDPHGMAVAATIVGYTLRDKPGEGAFGEGYATGNAGTYAVPGVAPGAKIIPIRVCEPVGCFGSAINAGVDYVTSLKKAHPHQPIVINESLGGPSLDPVEKAALDAAIGAGVVVVASAGNNGNSGMGFPGAYEPVISVGAGGWRGQWNEYPDNTWWLDDVQERTTPDDVSQMFIVSFSSRQKDGQYLDVVGPGRNMLLPYPCAQLYKDGQATNGTLHRTCASKASPDSAQSAPYQYLHISGTSFSAPAMAGIIALMLDKDGSLNNADAALGSMSPTSWGPGSLETLLEGTARSIAPGTANVTQRTGTPFTECWETTLAGRSDCTTLEATGAGWIFVDDALNAVP